MLEYQLIRSKRRKTLSLQVRHGHVTVRAPHYVSSAFIDSFIQEKSAWLRTKLTEQQEEPDFCDFNQGSHLLFLGEQLKLNIFSAKKSTVFIDSPLVSEVELFSDDKLSLRQLNVVISDKVSARFESPLAKAKRVKKLLETYFKQQAEQLFTERLEVLSTQTSLVPTKTIVRQYSARWGSCNNRGEVSFNYLLIMTPIFVIDYVIVHELCHLKHLNHSKCFWKLVEQYCPNYQIAKKWLKAHQSHLHWKTLR
jgi:predicted metal-dependent hydrolase